MEKVTCYVIYSTNENGYLGKEDYWHDSIFDARRYDCIEDAESDMKYYPLTECYLVTMSVDSIIKV